MDIVTMTDKGQITVPAALRKKYDLGKGNKLIIKEDLKAGFSVIPIHNGDEIDDPETWHRFAFASFTEWNDPADDVFDDL